MEIEKFDYLENEKSFFDEIESIFHSFWRAIIWLKNKNFIKIADTSFKETYAIRSMQVTYENDHIFLQCESTMSNAKNLCFLCI